MTPEEAEAWDDREEQNRYKRAIEADERIRKGNLNGPSSKSDVDD